MNKELRKYETYQGRGSVSKADLEQFTTSSLVFKQISLRVLNETRMHLILDETDRQI